MKHNTKDIIYHDKITDFRNYYDAIPFSMSVNTRAIIDGTTGREGKEKVKRRLYKALKLKGKTLVAVQWKNQRAIVKK